jgi:protein gp37
MSAQSNIEWTDATWNPIIGCTKTSPGCQHCYAERMALRIAGTHGVAAREYAQVVTDGKWNGRVVMREDELAKLQQWKTPRRVFVCSMSDLFQQAVSDSTISRVFGAMENAPQHIYYLLTKRPLRMMQFTAYMRQWENWWAGATCCNQHELYAVRDHELRWLSLEPLLDEVRIPDALWSCVRWIVVGPETGPGRRPCLRAWIKHLVEQANRHSVPVFIKAFPKEFPFDDHISSNPNEWPEWARRREWPA